MPTTRTPSTRSRASTAKKAPRRHVAGSSGGASKTRAQSLTSDAKAAVRSVGARATRAAKKVPTDTRTLSVVAGVIAGIAAAGVAIFMNRDRLRRVASTGGERLRNAASTGSERLRKAADDLSTMAHERIDQARDNITRLKARGNGGGTESAGDSAETTSMTGS